MLNNVHKWVPMVKLLLIKFHLVPFVVAVKGKHDLCDDICRDDAKVHFLIQ